VANTDGKGGFAKGKSGNPAGRPRGGSRYLANVLLEAGKRKDWSPLTNAETVSRNVWAGLVFGEIDFGGGKSYRLTAREWLDLLRWLHQHVDGTINIGVRAEPIEPELLEAEPEEVLEPEERKVVLAEPIRETYEKVMALEAGSEMERHWLAVEGHPKGSRLEW
jgi:hypothetical protein